MCAPTCRSVHVYTKSLAKYTGKDPRLAGRAVRRRCEVAALPVAPAFQVFIGLTGLQSYWVLLETRRNELHSMSACETASIRKPYPLEVGFALCYAVNILSLPSKPIPLDYRLRRRVNKLGASDPLGLGSSCPSLPQVPIHGSGFYLAEEGSMKNFVKEAKRQSGSLQKCCQDGLPLHSVRNSSMYVRSFDNSSYAPSLVQPAQTPLRGSGVDPLMLHLQLSTLSCSHDACSVYGTFPTWVKQIAGIQ